jgi:hypothetical protein
MSQIETRQPPPLNILGHTLELGRGGTKGNVHNFLASHTESQESGSQSLPEADLLCSLEQVVCSLDFGLAKWKMGSLLHL